ncbi:MAG: hypothetical protein IT324_11700 [Anaerolineae bacterium]|nr:hypothetical protein [Anaerolineae bacterium]
MFQHPALRNLVGILLLSSLLLSACNVKIETAACDHFTISFDNGGDPTRNGIVVFTAYGGAVPIGSAVGTISGTRTSVTIPFNRPIANGTLVTVEVMGRAIARGACNSGAAPQVTWFDPGDIRVDGWRCTARTTRPLA